MILKAFETKKIWILFLWKSGVKKFEKDGLVKWQLFNS